MRPTVLIFGSRSDASGIANDLVETGMAVTLAVPEEENHDLSRNPLLAVLPISECRSCTGFPGQFILQAVSNGRVTTLSTDFIVISHHTLREPNYSHYGLAPGKQIISLTDLQRELKAGTPPSPAIASAKRTAFLVGIANESTPEMTGRVMACAQRLQEEFRQQTYVFTGNLKVAAAGLEARYRKAKTAGTVFAKFTGEPPQIEKADGGEVTISFRDEVTRDRFRLSPDLTVIDETLHPSPFTRHISEVLRIHKGPDGVGPSDNVHRAAVLTNRRGIYAVGLSGWGPGNRDEIAEIDSVRLSLLKAGNDLTADAVAAAVIDTGLCVRCLTCLRICPHLAVDLATAPAINPRSCEGCGICAAECPRGAIQMPVSSDDVHLEPVAGWVKTGVSDAFTPSITAFCCSRSAMKAGELAACNRSPIPQGLRIIPVPCGGGISTNQIYEAFNRGADGILVMTCHPGNCHSEHGEEHLRKRVDHVSSRLQQMGVEMERLAVVTLASNMGGAFAEAAYAFEKQIIRLGPSRLRAGKQMLACIY